MPILSSTNKSTDDQEIAAAAAYEFEAWVRDGAEVMSVRGLQAAAAGPFQAATLANHVMFRTKDQLVESCDDEGGAEVIMDTSEMISEAADWFEGIGAMMRAAAYRLLVAASVGCADA